MKIIVIFIEIRSGQNPRLLTKQNVKDQNLIKCVTQFREELIPISRVIGIHD